MQISVGETGVIRQYGEGIGGLDGHYIIQVPESEESKLYEPGTKTWHPDTRTISVTPPEPVVVPDPGSDPRAAAFQALIATATSPEQATAIEQVAVALGIVIPTGG